MPSIRRNKQNQGFDSNQPTFNPNNEVCNVTQQQSPQPTLPTKTPITPETQRIRDQYPEIEFLEAGNVGSWLQERSDQLISKAEFDRNSIDVLKLFNGLVVAGGLGFITANPIVPIGTTLAAIGYGYGVIEDLISTHKFRPIPFIREGLMDFFSRMGSADARNNHEDELEYLSLIQYLSPFERSECDMLSVNMDYLTAVLTQIPTGKKFYAYRYLLRGYILSRGQLPGMQDIKEHIEKVNVDTNINLDAVEQYKTITSNTEHQTIAASNQSRLPQSVQRYTSNISNGDEIQDTVQRYTPNLDNQTNATKSKNTFEPRQYNTTNESYDTVQRYTDDSDIEDDESQEYSGLETLQFKDSGYRPKETKKVLRDFKKIAALPVSDRSNAVIDLLEDEGLQVTSIYNSQIMAVCSSQRGGKSSLMLLAAILMLAENPKTELYYFTTGKDIYPVRTTKHISALCYPDDKKANYKVAAEVYNFFRDLDNKSTTGSLKNVVVMVDEVAGILKELEPEEILWLLEYWLRAFAKTGGTLYLALHATNLMALCGKNTGWAKQFKSGVSWIGCKTEVVETESRLRPLIRATGEYFITDPDDFGSVVEPLGKVPNWLKVAKNPGTGQPDPVRSMLALFPEFHMSINEIEELAVRQRNTKKSFDLFSTDIVQDNSDDCATLHTDDDDETPEIAERLCKWLDLQLDKGHEHIFSRREIQRSSPIRQPGDVEIAINFLIKKEWFIDLGENMFRYTID
jgi:hypothetical protein